MRLEWSGDGGCLRLTGLTAADRARLSSALKEPGPAPLAGVYPVTDGHAPPIGFPATDGRFFLTDDALCFTPRHPFRAGQEYELRLGLQPRQELRIARPAAAGEPTAEVLAITPTAAEVPRNHLRFYVHFSTAMAEGHAAGSITLRRLSDGEAIAGSVLAMEPELWDVSRTRLTVLLEPGRIKRGLAPQLDAGYPLVAGQDVALQVAASFTDAHGQPLRAAATRAYRVVADVRQPVDPDSWRLTAPAAGTQAPFRVGFERSLDSALALRCLTVVDELGRPVRGRVALTEGEREWALTPHTPWTAGSYELRIDPVLEDLAGNSVSRVFDRELDERAEPTDSARPRTALPFSCR